MSKSEANFSHRAYVFHDVLNEIERLRIRRQEEVRDRPHPLLKRFTQQELTDEACPTYKNLLVGRSRRVPSRERILRIAEYLECSAAERNDLLLAARYLPESLELAGPQLRQALEQARRLMETLPHPAMIVTHTLHVEAVNEAFQRLFEFPPLTAIPQEQRHIFHFFFQHDLPMRERSTFNDQAVKVWQAGVSRSIQLFKSSNVLYRWEPWYQELVEHLCDVVDFRRYWERDTKMLDQQDMPSKLLLSRNAATGEMLPIQLRHVRISVCSQMYPCIMTFFPLDEAARVVFTSLGCAEASRMRVDPVLL
ncbi:MAG: hypothetical protein JOZ18_05105 [Chloroflexi bacterium]|nr:hypothetical protein [Chloroflexota bacterium]